MTSIPPDVHPDGLYNGTDTARLLGIGRTTLWRLVNSGSIRPRFDKRTLRPRYRGRDILAFWRATI